MRSANVGSGRALHHLNDGRVDAHLLEIRHKLAFHRLVHLIGLVVADVLATDDLLFEWYVSCHSRPGIWFGRSAGS